MERRDLMTRVARTIWSVRSAPARLSFDGRRRFGKSGEGFPRAAGRGRFSTPDGLLAMAIPSSRDAPHCRHPSVTIFIVKDLDKDSHKDSYPSDSGVAAVARAYFVSRSGKGDDACKRGKRGRLSRGARASAERGGGDSIGPRVGSPPGRGARTHTCAF